MTDQQALIPCTPPEGDFHFIEVALPTDPEAFGKLHARAREWQVSFEEFDDGERMPLFHHDPTHAVFGIMNQPGAESFYDMRAVFLYVCEGYDDISDADVQRLGCECQLHNFVLAKERRGPYAPQPE